MPEGKIYKLPDWLGGLPVSRIVLADSTDPKVTVMVETDSAYATIGLDKDQLVEVTPPLPAEPANGSVVALYGDIPLRVFLRWDNGWWEIGTDGAGLWGWESLCAMALSERRQYPTRLVPDPAVESPDRQVLEAALAWVAYVHKAPTSPNIWGDDHDHALIEAVDAYNASAALRSVRDEEEINS